MFCVIPIPQVNPDQDCRYSGLRMSIHEPPAKRHHSLQERISEISHAISEHRESVHHELQRIEHVSVEQRHRLPDEIAGCVFIGHTATDLDSIGAAIACAELFNGIAVRASEINSETAFALEHWKLPTPPPFEHFVEEREVCKEDGEKVLEWTIKDDRFVCLVDHNQQSQFNEALFKVNGAIRGCIDHHALQSSTFQTDIPIYVNIRPWGSACTIVAHMYVVHDRPISMQTAGILLCGILSDTLNLQSPTTTAMDKWIVALLAEVSGTEDVDRLAQRQFKAKSKELAALSTHALIRGDLKTFQFSNSKGSLSIAYGVVETVMPDVVLDRREEIMMELRALKVEKKVDLAFLAVVDILKLHSELIVVGPAEESIAKIAYKASPNSLGILDLGGRVSRKKEFLPPLSETIAGGWVLPPVPKVDEHFGEVVHECTPFAGCRTIRLPSISSPPTSSGSLAVSALGAVSPMLRPLSFSVATSFLVFSCWL